MLSSIIEAGYLFRLLHQSRQVRLLGLRDQQKM